MAQLFFDTCLQKPLFCDSLSKRGEGLIGQFLDHACHVGSTVCLSACSQGDRVSLKEEWCGNENTTMVKMMMGRGLRPHTKKKNWGIFLEAKS